MKRMIQNILTKLGLMSQKPTIGEVNPADLATQSPEQSPESFLPEALDFSPSPFGDEELQVRRPEK